MPPVRPSSSSTGFLKPTTSGTVAPSLLDRDNLVLMDLHGYGTFSKPDFEFVRAYFHWFFLI